MHRAVQWHYLDKLSNHAVPNHYTFITTNHQTLFIYNRTKITGWFPALPLTDVLSHVELSATEQSYIEADQYVRYRACTACLSYCRVNRIRRPPPAEVADGCLVFFQVDLLPVIAHAQSVVLVDRLYRDWYTAVDYRVSRTCSCRAMASRNSTSVHSCDYRPI